MRLAIVAAALVLGLTGCATPSAPPKQAQEVGTALPEPVAATSGDDYLQQAREASVQQQPELLLQAIERWQVQQECTKALKVARVLIQEPLAQEQQDRLYLAQGFCFLQQEQHELAQDALEAVSQNLQFLPQRWRLTAELHQAKGQHWQAAHARAEVISLNPGALEQQLTPLWQNLQQISDEDLQQTTSGPVRPWVELARISRQPAKRMLNAVGNWQQSYPQYPLPESLVPLLERPAYHPRHIAVLLPLSGRLTAQGNALKQGMLSAYFEDVSGNKPKLTFLDTNLFEQAKQQLRQGDYDFVIGPLLRDNILDYLNPSEQRPVDAAVNLPQLFLNRLEQPVRASDEQYFYALAPEDEAEQLVSDLLSQGRQHPIIISADGSPYQRMASHFVQVWQQKTGQQLPLATFTDNASMRDVVGEALSVAQSENRIRLMQRLVEGNEVYHFARNRRDLDAIVLFASAGQTELLNPIIESNISPFARILPVYASSNSYSQELGPNSLRDLHNLNFIDMPWILADADQPLKQQVQRLWPQRHDSQARLFAMGHDALAMISSLRQLAEIPGMTLQGLTGKLTMDGQGQLHRQLSQARITVDKVQRLDGD
ncbi:Penicillin-binding protein activator LpoA [Saliniradius amylolyticus]|uniref:Penicillin-binding protein activator LpoA n=1 Tax=Saliniradius amylolyticus TaxID=2183582 RepID=A0A2S2E5K4_9ALTE|nr:penicillin-binding protein activator [Saliniradius amylolyticus]AWL12935.1 Penicillin-binding protein activator LpoA [Saliniradius amylolyticus]